MKKTVVEVSDVTKKFGHYTALTGINFNISAGDIMAIIGPNGSGKSTLIRMMIGLDEPTSGRIRVGGIAPKRQAARIGYVPQHFHFDRSLPITVGEFLNIVPCPTSRHKEKQSINEALQLVGMDHLYRRHLGVLSGGELQRVLIARALLHERDILVLDEPSSGIDISGERAIYDLLAEINRSKGTTIIVVSHGIDFVFKYATRVICLNRRMVCAGSPAQVLSAETMRDLYGEVKHYHHGQH